MADWCTNADMDLLGAANHSCIVTPRLSVGESAFVCKRLGCPLQDLGRSATSGVVMAATGRAG